MSKSKDIRLTDAQRAAAIDRTGESIALLSGAGCGKTFVLSKRYVQLLLDRGWDLDAARNSVLLLMVLMTNIQTGASRSERHQVLGINPLSNPLLLAGVVTAQAVHIAALYLPGISSLLHTQPVTLRHWVELLVIASALFVVMETHKLIYHRLRA